MRRHLIFLCLLMVFRDVYSHGRPTSRPNIILFITDDQDSMLGSMEFMPKTLKFLRKRGVEFENAFVSTPMCCPSRSTILTGLYAHNHNIMTNNLNCGGEEWRNVFEERTFAIPLQKAGYNTAYFGKYLNEYDGSYIPPGWNYWMGLIRNSRFYNYTLNRNGRKEKHGFEYEEDYFTDVISNSTMKFIEESLSADKERPFMTVVSYPAPHGPEDPAPQYASLFENIDTHRTAAWNYAPNPDKQWLLQHTGKMDPVHVVFTDLLHRRRLQTLQSVDDSVHKIMSLLRATGILHNTYVIFSSDHGYHLGQFGLIKGKSMPYEFDIKVPFYVRGPGLPKGVIRREPVINVDIAPTIVDMAGLKDTGDYNGHSVLDLFDESTIWSETVLIERGKMPRLKKIGERFKKQKERYNKYLLISRQCSKDKYNPPCKRKQEWMCVKNAVGRWRILKCHGLNSQCSCRHKRELSSSDVNELPSKLLDSWENEFLRDVFESELIESGEWFQGALFDHSNARIKRDAAEALENAPKMCWFKSKKWCDIPANITQEQWERKRAKINSKIQNLKGRIQASRVVKDAFTIHPTPIPGLTDVDVEQECKCERPVPFSKHPLRHSFPLFFNRTSKNCTVPQMNCFEHSEEHWKTEPKWPSELGSFCFCQNSNNNSYWCLRTVNATHNFLYCEFVTGFLSFYDLNTDPHQLTNTVFELEYEQLMQLNEQLMKMKSCKTARTCRHYGSREWYLDVDEDLHPAEAPSGDKKLS